jgi:putative ABC transport system permease protein
MEILRNFNRRKLRSALTISGILIGILALTTMGAMAEHVNALLDGGVKYFSSSIQVGSASDSTPLLATSTGAQLEAVPGVAAAYPEISVLADQGNSQGISFGPSKQVVTWDSGIYKYGSLPMPLTSGRTISDGDRGAVVIGSNVARDWNLKVGSSVDLPKRPKDAPAGFVNHPFTVVGVLQPTLTAPDQFLYVSLPDSQMLLGDTLPAALKGKVDPTALAQGYTVYAAKGTSMSSLDSIAKAINAQVPGVKAQQPSQIVSSFKSGSLIFSAITTGAALLALVIGGLSVINTMLMAVSERVREIGLKKAIGAKTHHILREFMAESVAIGAIGGFIGYGLGVVLTTIFNGLLGPGNELFLVTPSLTGLAIGFAVFLGAIAGVIPAWRASRMDPVAALRAQ